MLAHTLKVARRPSCFGSTVVLSSCLSVQLHRTLLQFDWAEGTSSGVSEIGRRRKDVLRVALGIAFANTGSSISRGESTVVGSGSELKLLVFVVLVFFNLDTK